MCLHFMWLFQTENANSTRILYHTLESNSLLKQSQPQSPRLKVSMSSDINKSTRYNNAKISNIDIDLVYQSQYNIIYKEIRH
jgi:hypothetical protein